MHGSNRLGGNSLSDLLVFGRRAGEAARRTPPRSGERRPKVDEADVKAAAARAHWRRSRSRAAENPYTIQQDLQQSMNDLVGIIRTAAELSESLEEIEALKERAQRMVVEGHRQYNPGWHLALDLRNMLIVSECIAKAALARAGVARRPHPRRLPGTGRRVGHQEPRGDTSTPPAPASTWPRSRCR